MSFLLNSIFIFGVIMIESLTINNYRIFRHAEVESLSKVNLIVGNNSSGKTALLESIALFLSDCSPSIVNRIIDYRSEDYQQEKYHRVYQNLFYGRKIPEYINDSIDISSKGRSLIISILDFVRAVDPENGRIYFSGIGHDELDDDGLEDDSTPFLAVKSGEGYRRLINLDTGHYIGSGIRGRPTKDEFSYKILSTNGLLDQECAYLWDRVALTDDEDLVLDGLRIIEPSIQGVTFVDHGRSRTPLVKVRGFSDPFPLKSLGDGVSRIFHIILSIVSAKNSFLLIDEFENGLHWSAQERAWGMVFELAERLNVQIFCTTHSSDCVQTFKSIWGGRVEAGSFLRVTKSDLGANVKTLPFEILSDSIDMDVEVR